mmetsp:Transcript_25914/g.29920  ORF Transcript_25914/g.29920 Transcript_25914/m.29920 type:complete len:145 (+) Transcript_25914:110-544(+)
MSLMAKMKRLKIKIILSTDLLARGIDFPKVNIVINFDLCKEQNQYLHRIGRTGRFGVNGIALSFIPSTPSVSGGKFSSSYTTERVKNGLIEGLSGDLSEITARLQNEIDKALALNPIIAASAVEQAFAKYGIELEEEQEEENLW